MSHKLERTWSLSKSNTLDECPRKYYYHYYLSNNVCSNNDKKLVNEAKRLKKLSNRFFYSGNLIHDVTKEIVKDIYKNKSTKIDIENLKKESIFKFRSQCKKDLTYLKNSRCLKDEVLLTEYYYENQISATEGKNVLTTIDMCLENILKTKSIKELLNTDVSIIENSEDSFNSFLIDGTKTYAKLDLLYKDRVSEKYIIVDWKTGKENNDDRNQLLLYALYAMEKCNISIDEIICRDEYLKEGICKEYKFTNMDIEAFKLKAKNKIEKMNNYLESIDLNIPKDMKLFPSIKETSICNSCNYREICDGYIN